MWCLGQARRARCNGSGVVVSSLYIHLYWTYMGFQYRWQILPLSQTLKLTLRGTLFIEHFGFVQTDGFLSLTQTFDFLCKLVLVYEISLLSPMTQQPCLGLQEELWNESSKIWDMGVSVLFACNLQLWPHLILYCLKPWGESVSLMVAYVLSVPVLWFLGYLSIGEGPVLMSFSCREQSWDFFTF